MISSTFAPALTPDLLMCVLWSLVCFVAGVAYAAYRALGWVDRMRSWASTCPLPEKDSL